MLAGVTDCRRSRKWGCRGRWVLGFNPRCGSHRERTTEFWRKGERTTQFLEEKREDHEVLGKKREDHAAWAE